MRFLVNRRLHVNMGHFEHIETTATVEIDTVIDKDALKDLGVDVAELDQVKDFIQEQLGDLLEPDISEAAIHTDNEDSFVLPYEKDFKKMRGSN